jgi:hypothetical protein
MKRRSFITGMLAACAAPMWLPSAGRVWVPQRVTGFPFAPDPYPIRYVDMPDFIYQRIYDNSFWFNFLKGKPYPKGIGDTISLVNY